MAQASRGSKNTIYKKKGGKYSKMVQKTKKRRA